jgi:hypothetical protein
MNDLALSVARAILIGLGATLTFDRWALFLKHAFKITPRTFAWLDVGFDLCQKGPLCLPIYRTL